MSCTATHYSYSCVQAEVTHMRGAGVPVPEGFNGEKKSFTVPAPDDSSDETGSIGVLPPP